MGKQLFILTFLAVFSVYAFGNIARAEQEVEVKNSYLNVTSVNKKDDTDIQRVKIDKCFLSIIRINLGHHELPVKEDKE